MFFGKKKNVQHYTFDKDKEIPVLKCSICTGEKVAGFKDINTGRFKDIMLIKNDKDLESFMEMYDIKEIKREY